ncbi:hypothetical protein K9M50_00030 [Patescibacteria group bacterium]|nr:hypothetical protein [Patescibacteria group bacterium]
MLIKFKVKSIENDFIHLQNNDNEELKVKKENLSENIKIDDEINIKIFKEEDQKNLSKEILNEILNTSENK